MAPAVHPRALHSPQLQTGASGGISEEGNPVNRASAFCFSSYFQSFVLAELLTPIPVYCLVLALRRELHPTSTVPGSAVPARASCGRAAPHRWPRHHLLDAAPLRVAAFAEEGWGLQQGRDEPVRWNETDGEQGIQGALPQSSSSVCRDLEDVLKPFSKTDAYKRITGLPVRLASNGFVVVSKSQETMVFLKCHFQPWSWGKMISLTTLTNPLTAGYLFPLPTPRKPSQA